MKSPMTRVKEELGKIYRLLYYLKNTNTTHSQIHHPFFVCGEEVGSPICKLTAWCLCVCSEETIFINSNN